MTYDAEHEELKCLIEQGLAIDGEFIPLIIEGGLVDRSVGIDEPNYLTLPDTYDTPAVREALIDAHRAALAKARGDQ